jgi:hypothetical protein
MRRLLTLVALLVAGNIGNAQAATITFEDLAVPPGTATSETDVTSGGFLFDSLNHSHLVNAHSGVDNGSTYLAMDDVLGLDPTTFSPVGGGAFGLTSLDIGEWDFGSGAWAHQVVVTGNLFGGGTISRTLDIDGIRDGAGGLPDFQTFTFDATWAHLSSAVLKGIGSTPLNGNYYAIDNLVVAAAPPVPEPATLTLLGLGSAYLVGRRRHPRR